MLTVVGVVVLCLSLCLSAQAQWLTQSISLTNGWNAVYLHVDPSHDTLDHLLGDASNPIKEVWLWAPSPTTLQFTQSPQEPTDGDSQWVSWKRGAGTSSVLQSLVGNAAYLVCLTNVGTYTWNIKGKPLAPRYQWTTTGLNFLGFPIVPTSPPSFETFLARCPVLQQYAEVYQYVGGDLGSANPARLIAMRTTKVKRGQAYWIRAGSEFNRYFGPFEAAFSNPKGIDFGDQLSVTSFRLRNLISSNLTVTLRLVASETAPLGQTNPAPLLSLLVRGTLNPTNLTYGYTSLPVGGSQTWTLAAQGMSGSEADVVLGLNRAALTNPTGTGLAGILRLTDSLGFCQVDAPVTVTVGSSAGLWVGSAIVAQVGEYLKSYLRDSDGNLVVQTNGAYSVYGVNTDVGSVPRTFPLRLIVHNPESGNATMLQRVYVGLDANTNQVVARQESVLNPSYLAQARRISATHLPWTADNTAWAFSGRWPQTTNLTTSINLGYNDQASSPFVHSYHPDHDNLDATFSSVLKQGVESYSVQRDIQLTVTPPTDDFSSLTAGGGTVSGDYSETISIRGLARGGTNDTRTFQVFGAFSLNRISEVPILTTSP